MPQNIWRKFYRTAIPTQVAITALNATGPSTLLIRPAALSPIKQYGEFASGYEEGYFEGYNASRTYTSPNDVDKIPHLDPGAEFVNEVREGTYGQQNVGENIARITLSAIFPFFAPLLLPDAPMFKSGAKAYGKYKGRLEGRKAGQMFGEQKK
jgi:hypothetical protein